jgi:hypothetical protein
MNNKLSTPEVLEIKQELVQLDIGIRDCDREIDEYKKIKQTTVRRKRYLIKKLQLKGETQ